jgi:hypothetical protein
MFYRHANPQRTWLDIISTRDTDIKIWKKLKLMKRAGVNAIWRSNTSEIGNSHTRLIVVLQVLSSTSSQSKDVETLHERFPNSSVKRSQENSLETSTFYLLVKVRGTGHSKSSLTTLTWTSKIYWKEFPIRKKTFHTYSRECCSKSQIWKHPKL